MSQGFRSIDPEALTQDADALDQSPAWVTARSAPPVGRGGEPERPLTLAAILRPVTPEVPPVTTDVRPVTTDVRPVTTDVRPVTADDHSAEHPEAALIAGLQRGDQRAYRQLYRQYADDVARLARQFVYGDAEAEEVLQEVFISAFKYIDRFRGHSRLKTWLYRITVNRALKRRRWWSRRRETPEDGHSHRLSGGIGPERTAVGRESLGAVEALLARIEVRKRTVLVLHEVEGLDTRQIAEVLDCPRSTVLTRLSRARHELQALAAEAGLLTPGSRSDAEPE